MRALWWVLLVWSGVYVLAQVGGAILLSDLFFITPEMAARRLFSVGLNVAFFALNIAFLWKMRPALKARSLPLAQSEPEPASA